MPKRSPNEFFGEMSRLGDRKDENQMSTATLFATEATVLEPLAGDNMDISDTSTETTSPSIWKYLSDSRWSGLGSSGTLPPSEAPDAADSESLPGYRPSDIEVMDDRIERRTLAGVIASDARGVFTLLAYLRDRGPVPAARLLEMTSEDALELLLDMYDAKLIARSRGILQITDSGRTLLDRIGLAS